MGDKLGAGRIDPDLRERMNSGILTHEEADELREHVEHADRQLARLRDLSDRVHALGNSVENIRSNHNETKSRLQQLEQGRRKDVDRIDKIFTNLSNVSHQIENITDPPEWKVKEHKERIRSQRALWIIWAVMVIYLLVTGILDNVL